MSQHTDSGAEAREGGGGMIKDKDAVLARRQLLKKLEFGISLDKRRTTSLAHSPVAPSFLESRSETLNTIFDSTLPPNYQLSDSAQRALTSFIKDMTEWVLMKASSLASEDERLAKKALTNGHLSFSASSIPIPPNGHSEEEKPSEQPISAPPPEKPAATMIDPTHIQKAIETLLGGVSDAIAADSALSSTSLSPLGSTNNSPASSFASYNGLISTTAARTDTPSDSTSFPTASLSLPKTVLIPQYFEIADRAVAELRELARHEGWRFVKEKNNVAIFKKAVAGSGITCLKGEGRVAAPVSALRTICSDHTRSAEWDPLMKECKLIERLDGRTKILHRKYVAKFGKCPFFSQARDFVLLVHWFLEKETGTVIFAARSVTHPRCPPEADYIRGTIYASGVFLRPVQVQTADGVVEETDVTYISHVDLGGMPDVLVNIVSGSQPLYVDRLRQQFDKLKSQLMPLGLSVLSGGEASRKMTTPTEQAV